MAEGVASPAEVLDYWFGPAPSLAERRGLWFGKDPAADAEIRARFAATHRAARAGDLRDWLDAPDTALALVVVLDQFPRNMHRDTPAAFAADARALACARLALERGHDRRLEPVRRLFLYLPFEHSEDLADQRLSVRLFAELDREPGLADAFDHALRHYCVIARFGRFPHRNAILGRVSTAEEVAFLRQPGSRF
ncbi:MAG: DUF924 domain-containing protein [Thiobacillaceae bacterium]|jgi:uncharacterized protein (DUF924 family)|nr:DUF924 domain-containing protein [Thiobacillaceae bacterium]